MSYKTIPEEYDFTTEFPTWIIAYCIDTNSWFCTNQRFFYYEYPKEFECENDAIEYFRNHIPEFSALTREMYPGRNTDVFLENTREKWVSNIEFHNVRALKDLVVGKNSDEPTDEEIQKVIDIFEEWT